MIKKKFYKDVWFWLFIISFLIGSFFTIGDFAITGDNQHLTSQNKKLKKEIKGYKALLNLSDYNSDSSDDESDNSSSSDTEKTFSVGESIEFKSGEKVTVNSISNSGTQLQDADADQHAVAVNVTIENTGSSPLDFNAQEFDLYDSDDELAEFNAITYENNIPNSIATGKKATMDLIFGAKKTGTYSVTYGDATWHN
ncbi:DUF4352 domain-containing protein [Latilactobacillus sakei]|uniref:DUF4352 domain-containing protein n=1 Tax=Latilactobacillus sakei TaxID=1599 RepID=UPI0020C79B5F|nr:DUF4352 domain-containing protein [Latilactobacillus sakei]MCP8851525.1 DUF4352 domain-containing protein [Latilactobacillus sakei]